MRGSNSIAYCADRRWVARRSEAHSASRFGSIYPFASSSGNAREADGWYRRIADVADRGLGRLSWADCGPTSSPRGTTGVGTKGVIPSRALSRLDRRKQALVEAAAERPKVKSGPSQAAACRSIAILRDGTGLRPSQHGRVNAGFFCLSCGTAARSDWGRVDAPCVVPYGPRAKVQGRNRGWNDARF